jgi:hypothetical protein
MQHTRHLDAKAMFMVLPSITYTNVPELPFESRGNVEFSNSFRLRLFKLALLLELKAFAE